MFTSVFFKTHTKKCSSGLKQYEATRRKSKSKDTPAWPCLGGAGQMEGWQQAALALSRAVGAGPSLPGKGVQWGEQGGSRPAPGGMGKPELGPRQAGQAADTLTAPSPRSSRFQRLSSRQG